MGEMRVTVDSMTDSHGNQLNIHSDGSVSTTSIPEGALAYSAMVFEAPGVVAANNFLSIFNPASSGKLITVLLYRVYPYSGAAASATNSMAAWRTSAASGGTLRNNSTDLAKFDTTQPNSIAEVRHGNPTCTLVNTFPVAAIPPAITAAGAGVGTAGSVEPPSGTFFRIRPGEGVVARTAGGDVDQVWTIAISWYETAL